MTRSGGEGAGPTVLSGCRVDCGPAVGLTPVQGHGKPAGHDTRLAALLTAHRPGPEESHMALLDRLKRDPTSGRPPRWTLGVSDETKLRAASAALWALVSLAAVGGVTVDHVHWWPAPQLDRWQAQAPQLPSSTAGRPQAPSLNPRGRPRRWPRRWTRSTTNAPNSRRILPSPSCT